MPNPKLFRRLLPMVLTAVAGLTVVFPVFAADKAPSTRPAAAGGLQFKLEGDASKWDPKARAAIEKAMAESTAIYNKYGHFSQTIPAVYSPETPTADASFGGHIRFGGQIGTRTALHEIAHILGVGTAPGWRKLVVDGKWTGPIAKAQLKLFDGPDAVLHADRQHFWPYGLNYDSEGTTPEQFRRHVLMVIAMRADLGLGPKFVPTTQP